MTTTIERAPDTIKLPTDGSGSNLDGNWKVIVLNDNHNTFEGVASALAKFIPGCDYGKGMQFANSIHRSGQAIVWTGMKEPAELYWEQLRGVGLTLAPLEQD